LLLSGRAELALPQLIALAQYRPALPRQLLLSRLTTRLVKMMDR